MLNAIEVIENKIRPMLTINLWTLLVEMDKKISAARVIAQQTENFDEVQAHNTVRTAIINILDERDSNKVDDYLSARSLLAA
jgi:hypothetical protein